MLILFIDTSEYRARNFHFDSEAFCALVRLCENEVLHLVTTTVTVEECVAQARREATSEARQFRAALAKTRMLRHVSDAGPTLRALSIMLRSEDHAARAEKAVREHFSTFDYEILDVDDVAPSDVMELHFRGRPPFSVRKPGEFKDAFALLRLEQESESDLSIAVVSRDPDMKAFCEERPAFRHFDDISKFLRSELAVATERAALIEGGWEGHEDDACRLLQERLLGHWVHLPDELDGEGDIVEVRDVEIGDIEISWSDAASFEIDCPVTATVVADVTYANQETVIYDKEDDIYFVGEHESETLEETLDTEARFVGRWINDTFILESVRLAIIDDAAIVMHRNKWD